jgi:FkbM family methyltransferase
LSIRVTGAAATNELNLHCINSWEAKFLRKEVGSYFAHGIQLHGGATVVDVGANIGIFSASVYNLLNSDVQVVAFEPLPPIFAVLERNMQERCGGRATALPYGLSSCEGEVEFTYFPRATVLSSSVRSRENVEPKERRRVAEDIARWAKDGGAGLILKQVPAFIIRSIVKLGLRSLKQTETHRVRVRPLSAVIDELGIKVIDLLKIDVEGAEVDVLNGIDEHHWPMIHQVVVEVEDWETNYPLVQEIFEPRYVQVHAVQDSFQKTLNIGMFYAIGSLDRTGVS